MHSMPLFLRWANTKLEKLLPCDPDHELSMRLIPTAARLYFGGIFTSHSVLPKCVCNSLSNAYYLQPLLLTHPDIIHGVDRWMFISPGLRILPVYRTLVSSHFHASLISTSNSDNSRRIFLPWLSSHCSPQMNYCSLDCPSSLLLHVWVIHSLPQPTTWSQISSLSIISTFLNLCTNKFTNTNLEQNVPSKLKKHGTCWFNERGTKFHLVIFVSWSFDII